MDTDEHNQDDNVCDIPGYSSTNEFAQQGLNAVVQATRSSNELPVGDDFDFYSTFPAVREVMDIEGRRILSLLQKIVRYHNVKGNLGPHADIDVEDRFDIIMDTNDQILEKAGTLLDEASGIKKQESKLLIAATPTMKPSTSWNRTPSMSPNTEKAASAYRLLTARNIQRPQLRFKSKIDNSYHPFKPIIREKPNALKTLEDSLALPANVTLEDSEQPDFIHPHPYAFELEAFSPELDWLLKRCTPVEPRPLLETPLIMVNTEVQLRKLLVDLRKETEIAIDLEHHSYRSFQGLTCLMQISTRSTDYIVDTLELRESLYILNEVFTDPQVTKVLHGADSDVKWLQRDLGLYLVNLFDTGQAARVLCLSRFSLAHLMMVYVRVEANKQFQLADWRIRPLPQELINYAREDTHYLLYIYDTMRNQLLDGGNERANLLQSVYNRSKTVAEQIYCKPFFNENHCIELYAKSKKVFNARQMSALKSLSNWRNHTARQEDESYGYVLPNHMLLQIAEILPRERQGVLACCNPIPPLVRQSLPEIHNMIFAAREIAINKVEKKLPVSKPSVAEHPKYNPDSLLNCPHDMTHNDEHVAYIERSISETGMVTGSFPSYGSLLSQTGTVVFRATPAISAFSGSAKKMTRTAAKKLADQVKSLFSNPFTKYFPKELRKAEKRPVAITNWRLKASTHSEKPENKSETLDLDSFEPEFVQPAKKPKMSVNLFSPPPSSSLNGSSSSGMNEASSSSNGSSNSRSIFKVPAPPVSASTFNKPDKEKKVKNKDKVHKSLKQEAGQIKKARKKKEKRSRLREEAKQQADISSSSPVMSSTPTSDGISESSSITEAEGENRKKKKKKKVNMGDIGKNFTAFNYDNAEEQLKKEWGGKKKLDVFNPHFSRNKGKGKKGGKFNKSSQGNKKSSKEPK